MSDTNKPRPTLIQRDCAMALALCTDVLEAGIYGDRKPGDWLRMDNAHARCTDALYRHLSAEMQGELLDPRDGLAHDAHAAVNALLRVELRLRGIR